jgi:DNA-binding response OmpR family regulator/DNA-binding CsgD family transcriptional regulator
MNSPDKNTKTIALVVDDAIDSIHMLNDVLEDANFTVLVALEGNQALTIAQNITPDIILLDAIMPNMDGFETCRRLKQNPALADVPIIFMTGLSDTEHVVMGLNAGGVDYVTKPINAQELVARMRVHLTNARLTQSARAALDTAGHYLFATDHMGQMLWATPQVRYLLQDAGVQQDVLSNHLSEWFTHQPEHGRCLTLTFPLKQLTVEFLTLIDHKEFLLKLAHATKPAAVTEVLRHQFAVTGREADVLMWVANGKTNREIGQILEMSPRTVNKHLEQIFRKLGVENRTSAAAVTLKYLAKA